MALRTACYGTVRWLLQSMRNDHLPGDLETWQLRVRWLVQSGMWDKAWKETMEALPQLQTLAEGGKLVHKVTGELPLSIWMEFFKTMKDGTTQMRPRRQKTPTLNTQVAMSLRSTPPHDSSYLYATRYHTLMNNRPTIIPEDLSKTPPRVIYNAVSIMLNVGQANKALSFFKSYLECLPPSITMSRRKVCLDILHLLVAKWSSQTGLRRLYETRRMMVSLLLIYPTLRPTSTTLFLLLAPLYRAKRCGTVAANVMRAFKRDYGAATEDRRVRRRVVILALKEGRMDIAHKILRAEQSARAWREAATTANADNLQA
ncbi:hypothetical protein J132_00373 [Termitomyces sp. J132]|nr:hypothetical protein J132_00373 [Termitomyces sp. J132]